MFQKTYSAQLDWPKQNTAVSEVYSLQLYNQGCRVQSFHKKEKTFVVN